MPFLFMCACQGMVIVIANGDHGISPDNTRELERHDCVYNLKDFDVKNNIIKKQDMLLISR